jgi:DNA-binding NarL/FixJ family response regulator
LRLNEKQLLCEQLSSSKQHFNTISRELIQTRAELLEIENARIVKLSKEDDLRKMSFIQSEIYLKLVDLSKEEKGKKMTKEDWLTLEQELNNTYNNFSLRLKSCCDQISEAELHVCYLLKAGLSVTSIAKIVGRTKSAVSMCRKRLLNKINGCNGSTFDLDKFISNI